MSDGVKFIFKTLLKVPIIIFTSFFVFNILVFFLIYFKMLGFSYVVMQTAVENNYLPTQELLSLAEYAHSMDVDNPYSQHNTSIITNFAYANDGQYDHRVELNESGTGIRDAFGDAGDTIVEYGGSIQDDALYRKQYGKVSRVGVYTDYTVVWPLDYRDMTTTGGVAGFARDGSGSSDNTSMKSDLELEAMRNREFHQGGSNTGIGGKVVIPIRIVYTVPGLKYYPDLINY